MELTSLTMSTSTPKEYKRMRKSKKKGNKTKPRNAEHNIKVCLYEVHRLLSRHVRSGMGRPRYLTNSRSNL
jgi:hypothetical protein